MLKALLKIRLAALFSGGKRKDGRPNRLGTVGVVVLMLFLALVFGFFFLIIATPLAMALVPSGLHGIYFAIFNLITFVLVFVFSIFETKSQLFECRDNELLLSMPIPSRMIVISRALSIILINVCEAIVVITPALIMFVVFGGSAWYIPSVLIVSVLITVLATALSSAVGYLVALISSRLKNRTFITVILTFGFLALYFVGYDMFLDALTSIEENPEAATDIISATFGSIAFLGNISLLKPIETIIFVVISVGISFTAWLIISKHYASIITRKPGEKKTVYVRKDLARATPFAAMAKKEIAAFLSDSAYILNGVMGAIFQIVIAVMLLFAGDNVQALASAFGGADSGVIEVAVTMLLVGCASTTSISASALSLEGKHLWIIKSSPISAETVIYAKLVPHLMISIPASLISSVIAAIALGAHPLWWIFIILLPIVAVFVFAMLGLVLNIAMPKFEFISTAHVVKQSAPVFILTMGGMALIAVLAIGSILLSALLGALLTAVIFSAFFVLLFLALYLVLTGPSARRLEKIS